MIQCVALRAFILREAMPIRSSRLFFQLFACGFALLSSEDVRAEPHHKIAIYADAAHLSTEAFDLAPGILTIYLVHEVHEHLETAATSAAFQVFTSAGFTGVWLDDTTQFPHTGSSPTGITIAYLGCLPTPLNILEVRYTVFGTSAACSYVDVGPHPDHGKINTHDCSQLPFPGVGARLTVNPNETCSPLPIESTTWGKIKSLYRTR